MTITTDIPKLYEYEASITWVFDFMIIKHVCCMQYETLYDLEMAESVIITAGESFIYDHYGLDISMIRKTDVYVDWQTFPEES